MLITTADLPESKRFVFWQDVVCDTFSPIDCVKTSDRPFAAEIATNRIRDYGFSRLRCQEFRALRTAAQIRQSREEDRLFIHFQTSGQFLLSQDGRESCIRPGACVVIDNTRPWTGSLEGNFGQVVIHVPREIWVRRVGVIDQLTARAVDGTTQTGRLVTNFLRDFASAVENVEEATALRLSEILLALMATALGETVSFQGVRRSDGRLALLYRAKAIIEENLQDPCLTPENVARALKISTSYLYDIFHDECATVSNWIWGRRLERCRQNLSDSLMRNKSLSEIAFDCGFSDLSHFNHRFKAAFSMTPSQFRRNKI
jgi:AraC-like DNA-binding protein